MARVSPKNHEVLMSKQRRNRLLNNFNTIAVLSKLRCQIGPESDSEIFSCYRAVVKQSLIESRRRASDTEFPVRSVPVRVQFMMSIFRETDYTRRSLVNLNMPQPVNLELCVRDQCYLSLTTQNSDKHLHSRCAG
jgi:hypothetical protein